MKALRNLYDGVMRWGQTPHGPLALFVVAFAESSFFPIPPDVLLIALCLALPQRSYAFALNCSIGSVLGGVAGYGIGYGFWAVVQNLFYTYVPGVTPESFAQVQSLFADYGFWVVFTAGFTPIPYKIFTVGAGVFQLDFGLFVGASIISRSLRFFLVAGLLHRYGHPVKLFIERYFNLLTLAGTLLLLVLVVLWRWLHGG